MPAREAFMKIVQDNQQREKTFNDKAKVLADLEASFQKVHSALEAASDADLSKPIKFFGEHTTPRGVCMAVIIAICERAHGTIHWYARMNGDVPPWSRAK
jgi:hypothetical protein